MRNRGMLTLTKTQMEGWNQGSDKQMIIILQSLCVETGFFCELLSRLFHGRKQDIHSFESAKVLLSKGEPVIIGKLTKIWELYLKVNPFFP